MRLTIKSFFKNPIFFFLIILCFLRPPCIDDMCPNSIYQILALFDKLIGIPVIMLCLIAVFVDNKCFCEDVIAYYIYKIIATILVTFIATNSITGGGSFRHLRVLSAIWYVALALKYNYWLTIKRLTYLLSIIVIINFLTIIVFPGGMYFHVNHENYFWGYDNGHAVLFMPALFFSVEYALNNNKKFIMFITWGAVYLSAIICKSGTTVLGLFVLAFLSIVIHLKTIKKYLINWKTISIIVIAVFIFIVVLRKQESYRELIMVLFGKDTTLTGRTILWDRAFDYIKEKPMLGVGDNTAKNINLFRLNTQMLAYAHNEFLDILVRSGFIGLILYILCIVNTIRISDKKNIQFFKMWLIFMLSFWVMMMFESYSNYSLYFFYFILILLPRYRIVADNSLFRTVIN